MPTIKDVAKRAGVSTGTVSMVINGSSSVKMETRVRVLQVIKEMGYTPNQYARSLVTKRKNVIGIIRSVYVSDEDAYRSGYHFEELPDTYLADMLDDIMKELTSLGYSLLLGAVSWSGIDDPKTLTLPPIAQSGRIDGMMWASGFMSDRQQELIRQLDIPVVTIGSRFDVFDWVDTDPEEGIYQMTKYVLSQGHKEIAFINGLDATQTSARKAAGLRRAIEEAGLEISPENMEKSAFSGLGGYNAMKRIWERGVRPTAVITALDVLAMGAMRYLGEMGLRVPDDVSVTGFEDGILAEYASPRLTTVFTRKEELGTQASRILANRIANPKAQQVRLIIPPKLIIRETVRDIRPNAAD